MAGISPVGGNPPGLGVHVDQTILEQGNLSLLVTKVEELSAGVAQGVDVTATPGVISLIAPILTGVTKLGIALWDKIVGHDQRLQVLETGLSAAEAAVNTVVNEAQEEFEKMRVGVEAQRVSVQGQVTQLEDGVKAKVKQHENALEQANKGYTALKEEQQKAAHEANKISEIMRGMTCPVKG